MFYPPLITSKTEHISLKVVCVTSDEAFNRRLAHGVVIIIITLYCV